MLDYSYEKINSNYFNNFNIQLNLEDFGIKVWDKCFAGQIHCLIGLPPDADELKEYANIVKTAMAESFHK